jgi:hypothetical protein
VVVARDDLLKLARLGTLRSSALGATLVTVPRNQFIRNQLVPSFWEGAARITGGPRGLCFVEDSREPLPVALATP